MSTPSGLLLPASIVTAALIMGASIAYHASQNRYEISAAGASASAGFDSSNYADIAIYRLDKASGVVTRCQSGIDEEGKRRSRLMDCSGITPKANK